ncbi:hypothetical protein T09_5183 [Trichinella sp. T9]|nr:hypothetical protein T09_5183 [Trichinella sp. T9]
MCLMSSCRGIDIWLEIESPIDPKGSISTTLATPCLRKHINPFDEIALEEAIRMKEQKNAAEVIAVNTNEAANIVVIHNLEILANEILIPNSQ